MLFFSILVTCNFFLNNVMRKVKLAGFFLSIFVGCCTQLFAQSKKGEGVIIDKITAIVGGNPILQSDVENEFNQMILQGANEQSLTKCGVLEEMMFNKLLVHQAELDSVEISEAQIQGELDQRMHYYIQQIGSEQKLEEYMGKSIAELKEDYKSDIEKMLMARNVQQKITADIKVSPSDVRNYFSSIPTDSLPRINAEYELQQIVKRPPISDAEKKNVKDKIERIRERIANGEDFGALAVLYSEDTESAKRSGELGLVGRGDLVSEFSAAAFSLKGKEVSQVIETQFGYHILQLIERRGEMINVKHILLIPKLSTADLLKSQQQLDSVRALIVSGSLTFEEAAEKFSDDPDGKTNGGLILNSQDGTSSFEAETLDPSTFFIVDKLKVGEVSSSVKLPSPDGKQFYKLIKLKSRSNPHTANLREDYQRISNIALQLKQNKAINDWITKKRKNVYVKLDTEFTQCKFKHTWVDVK